MVKIRMMRIGSKKNAHYRMVAVDSRTRRSGDYLELIGYYDPTERVAEPLRIDAEKAKQWLDKGAQPSETALKLLEKVGVSVGNVTAKRKSAYRARSQAAGA
jgi:small subunit ribosomal protein S16